MIAMSVIYWRNCKNKFRNHYFPAVTVYGLRVYRVTVATKPDKYCVNTGQGATQFWGRCKTPGKPPDNTPVMLKDPLFVFP